MALMSGVALVMAAIAPWAAASAAPNSHQVARAAAGELVLAERSAPPLAARVLTVSRPVLRSTGHVEEGDRFTVTATIAVPKRARRVVLQKWYVPTYYGTPSWQTVKTLKVRGHRKINFNRTAIEENRERYRLLVNYRGFKKPVASRAIGVTVWRWIPLSEYAPYYEVGGAIFGTASVNGRVYEGWGAAYSSHTGSWEGRFTPGRHCKSFKAVLGVADISADDSSATIAFTTDDAPIYTSPSLTPGKSLPIILKLKKPYRFGIQLRDTTPGGTTGRDATESWPFLADPAFLCTGT